MDKPDSEKRHWTPNPTGKGLPPGKWAHLPTKLIRVPEVFAGEVLAIARALDEGKLPPDDLRSLVDSPPEGEPQPPKPTEYLPGDLVTANIEVGDRTVTARAKVLRHHLKQQSVDIHILAEEVGAIAQDKQEVAMLIRQIRVSESDITQKH